MSEEKKDQKEMNSKFMTLKESNAVNEYYRDLEKGIAPPGLRHLLETGAVPKHTSEPMTYKELKELVEDIYNTPRPEEPRKVIIGRYCKTHGYIMDDGSTIDAYCSNPECTYCNDFHNLLADSAKEFIAKM